MKNLTAGLRVAWATRSGPCFHPFYCVLLSNQRKGARRDLGSSS